MKACFDTSALVAALLQHHPHHALAFPLLREVKSGTISGHLATHGLAELFATLTALPLKPRLHPPDVDRIIQQSILPYFTLIPQSAADYREALQLTVQQNLSSGAIYDALHLVAARSVGCTALYTLNLRHFRSLAPGDSIVASPGAVDL
ncbi:MAG: PIN domain-containing protein [Opitutales bacterium]|nr:PIN domain-containing protein [Opitutales bacterium]